MPLMKSEWPDLLACLINVKVVIMPFMKDEWLDLFIWPLKKSQFINASHFTYSIGLKLSKLYLSISFRSLAPNIRPQTISFARIALICSSKSSNFMPSFVNGCKHAFHFIRVLVLPSSFLDNM